MCLKVDRATRCNCSWMADGREKSLRRRATSRRTRRRPAAAHTCAARPRRRNHCSLAYYCTGHICAQSVRARATRKHTDGFFDFHSDFFFSSLKSEHLKLTNNKILAKMLLVWMRPRFFLKNFATEIINLIKIDRNWQSSEKTIKYYWFIFRLVLEN